MTYPLYTCILSKISFKYDCLIVTNATFNINLVDVLLAGYMMNCSEVYIVNVYSGNLLSQDSGVLVGLGQRFDVAIVDNQPVYKFQHLNETDSVYIHSVEAVRQLQVIRFLQMDGSSQCYAIAIQIAHHSDIALLKFCYVRESSRIELVIHDDLAPLQKVVRVMEDALSSKRQGTP